MVAPMSAERYTATLTELRPREIMVPLPVRLVLRVTTAGTARTLEVDGPLVTVGANPGNAVRVDDDSVSGVHCELRVLENRQVQLCDLGSKNGTWIDSIRVSEASLDAGTTFAVGRSTIALTAVGEIDVPVSTVSHFGELYGRGAAMGKLFAELTRLASIDVSVLVEGETGTGKELAAKGIHDQSDRREGPFVVVDCTNLNEGLAESILFGHRKGSFTHALEDRAGLLEAADGGTVFLDEIGELSPTIQPKLLRALESRQTRRIGESQYRPFDTRIIAATNRHLPSMVCQGSFREDLYFRIAPITVRIPPLRERNKGNMAMLADLFLARVVEERGLSLRLEKAAYQALDRHSWPGNVRELHGVVRLAAMLAHSSVIRAEDLRIQDVEFPARHRSPSWVEEIERAMTLTWAEARRVLARVYHDRMVDVCDGNKQAAAKRAGMSRGGFRQLGARGEEDNGGSD